jgi:hypothetical protein
MPEMNRVAKKFCFEPGLSATKTLILVLKDISRCWFVVSYQIFVCIFRSSKVHNIENEIKPRIAMAKTAFDKKMALFTSKIALKIEQESS